MTRGHPDSAWSLLEDMKERTVAPSPEMLPVLGDLGKDDRLQRGPDAKRMIEEMIRSGVVKATDAQTWLAPLSLSSP